MRMREGYLHEALCLPETSRFTVNTIVESRKIKLASLMKYFFHNIPRFIFNRNHFPGHE